MIYIVTGHPRSGTSMLMECAEAGGMTIVKSPKRDKMIGRLGDESYRMNSSLYEPDNIRAATFPRMYEDMVVKVVAPFVRRIAAGNYRVVVMRRDPEEIRQSSEAAYGLRTTTEKIEEQIDEAVKVLRQRRDVQSIMELNYTDILDNPTNELSRLDWPFDVCLASAVVDPSKYRFRLDRLEVGL